MKYFAYGSCMDPASFSLTVHPRHFEILGSAILREYRLAFTLYSGNRNGGVADVVPLPGDYVEGVLYNLHPEALPSLDEREGVSLGLYKRHSVTVEYKHKSIEAMTYMVVQKSEEEIPPSIEYAQLIYNGAVQHLSFHYLMKLKKLWKTSFGLELFNHFERTNQ